jgi:hypothetical protein
MMDLFLILLFFANTVIFGFLAGLNLSERNIEAALGWSAASLMAFLIFFSRFSKFFA